MVQSGFQQHYPTVHSGFRHSDYAGGVSDGGILAPEQSSQYHSQHEAEHPNQSEFVQQGYQRAHSFDRRGLQSGSLQHEDEDMYDSSYNDERNQTDNRDGHYGNEEGNRGYANDSDVFDGRRDLNGDHGRQYIDDEGHFGEDEDDGYSVADDDGSSGGHDGSSHDDNVLESGDGYR